MKLILTRHGETFENKNRILQGHLPGKLSELGINQARKLAQRLKDERIDLIVSSDLARAADTAKEIARYHPNIPIFFTEKLRETDFKELTGKEVDNMDWKELDSTDKIESKREISERAMEILNKIYKDYKDSNILFVAHAGINQILINKLMGNLKKFKKYQKNTGITVMILGKNKKPELQIFNCTKHLD